MPREHHRPEWRSGGECASCTEGQSRHKQRQQLCSLTNHKTAVSSTSSLQQMSPALPQPKTQMLLLLLLLPMAEEMSRRAADRHQNCGCCNYVRKEAVFTACWPPGTALQCRRLGADADVLTLLLHAHTGWPDRATASSLHRNTI